MLPELFLNSLSMNILNDDRMSSLLLHLPDYQFDEASVRYNFIHSLVVWGRDGLLVQMYNSSFSAVSVSTLIGAQGPKAVINGIRDSPHGQNFDANDLDHMALAGYGDLPTKSVPNQFLPLWVLQSSQQHGLPAPEHDYLCDPFSLQSIPFWIELISGGSPDLLKLLRANGNQEIQMILRHLDRIVVVTFQDSQTLDSCQALLTYLLFSELHTPSAISNLENMIESSPFISLNNLYALLHYKKIHFNCSTGYCWG